MLLFLVFAFISGLCLNAAEDLEDGTHEKYAWLFFSFGCFALAFIAAARAIFE